MATITRRKSGYQVEVRRKGFPTVSRMFDSRKEAEAWCPEVVSGKLTLRRGVSASGLHSTLIILVIHLWHTICLGIR